MGVQGFPTLKIVKPGKKAGSKPFVEDYQGPREAKAIIDAVQSKINNHVTYLKDKDLEAFLKDNNGNAKAILFTEKSYTNPQWKAVAIDFLGSMKVAQIKSTEKATAELFGITKFPTVVLIPGGQTDAIEYDGKKGKEPLVKWLSEKSGLSPNPDPAPKNKKTKSEKPNKKEKKSSAKAESSFKSASKSHKSSEASSAAASATDETIIDDAKPTESPSPEVDSEKPIVLDEENERFNPLIPVLPNTEELVTACLVPTAGTCVLAFVPAKELDAAVQSVKSLSDIKVKYSNKNLFPFYTLPETFDAARDLKQALGLEGDVNIIAINTKRGWMRKYSGTEYGQEPLESWIDAIRMGEGEKTVLPGVLLSKAAEATAPSPSTAESAPEATPEPEVDEPQAAEPLTPEEPADPSPQADPEATLEVDIPETVTGETSTTTIQVEEAEKNTKGHDEL